MILSMKKWIPSHIGNMTFVRQRHLPESSDWLSDKCRYRKNVTQSWIPSMRAALVCALLWAQVLNWWAQWPEHRDTFLLEFGPWERIDLTVNVGAVTGRHQVILVNLFALRSTCCHGPNYKMKASPCSAHWAYQHETSAKKGGNLNVSGQSGRISEVSTPVSELI